MERGTSIIIEATGNGFLVRPYLPNGGRLEAGDLLVFCELGVAEPSGLSPDAALTVFIKKHFEKRQ